MPGISGPGAIAVVIGMSSEIAELRAERELVAYIATVLGILSTIFVIWLTLRSGGGAVHEPPMLATDATSPKADGARRSSDFTLRHDPRSPLHLAAMVASPRK